MLKRFFLNVLSSFVGAWAAIILILIGISIFIIGIFGSMVSRNNEGVSRHSVLKIVLGGAIDEIETDSKFDYTILLNGRIEKPQTLKMLLAALEKAKTNSDIDALYIECSGVSAAPATLDVLRKGIKAFKESGKRVFAYGDFLTMGDYYVATMADALYLNPAGSLNLQGISGTSIYMKDLLDKVGIGVQAVRVGTYKSAIEPYVSNEMSPAARLQLDSLYGEMWQYILADIAEARKVKAQTVDSMVNRFIFLDKAETAKRYSLVDNCLYFREVLNEIADYVGEDPEDVNFVSPETLVGPQAVNMRADNQIAVVYAVGEIGEYDGAGIDCHSLVPIIVSLADNDEVKGMVLRVNSPGGSVFGSEQIGEALDYFKSKGKPLAVSMGDYAASGGYWISACADIIYADPLTVTGSIGIFGLVPNISGLAKKIGITPQTVSTNPGVLFPSIFYPMTQEQSEALQKNIERGYSQFISRVAQGRGKTEEYVRSIAEGRVWSAIEAQKLGLVDKLGDLSEAIDWVADKASVSKPNIVDYPEPDSNIWSVLSSTGIASSTVIRSVIDKMSEDNIDGRMINLVEWFLQQNPVQARSPYYFIRL